jgi:quinol-cytochrome oxidoreductase complex cytochrome b subunit
MRRERHAKSTSGIGSRVWHSFIGNLTLPRDDRERAWVTLNALLLHFRPARLPVGTLRYTHTFGLGGMSLVLVSMLMVTGVLMMFAYEPSPERAHESVVRIEEAISFGRLVRAVHHWSANFVIIVVLLHLLRVFFTGGFRGNRQFNWIVGLALLACILTSNFTGYLLPWDQLSYWAVTICTGMLSYVPGIGAWLERAVRGGPEIGSATLVIFYALHTTVVPVLLVALMAWHFWRVRKAGGVVIPPGDGHDTEALRRKVVFLPNLLLREVAVGLILIAFVLAVATFFAAPLGSPANPGMSPNPAKAPWYFLGLQELLLHFHPTVAVLAIPGISVLAVLALPYLRYDADLSGRWFLSAKGRRMGIVAAVTALVVTPLWIVVDERVGHANQGLAGAHPFIVQGLAPLIILLVGVTLFYRLVKSRYAASRDESVQALFILLFVAFAVLTFTGIWFRGAGMALVWPWEV